MKTRRLLLQLISAVLLFLVVIPLASGESTDCNNPSVIAPDGRFIQSTIAAAATYWFGVFAQPGHSYSVEFLAASDNAVSSGKVQFFGLAVVNPGDLRLNCTGTTSLVVVQTAVYSPVFAKSPYGAGRRASFTAGAADKALLYPITIMNLANVAGPYTYRVVDTTLFAPRWSTYSGYDTQWGMMNVSDMNIDGIFTVFNANNQVLRTVSLSIPAGQLISRFSGPRDLNLPRNSSGYVIFSHDGPPNSIVADSYMLNGSATVVVPTKFEAHGSQ